MRALSPKIREMVVAAVDRGELVPDIAKRFAIEPNTVRNLLRLRARTGGLEPRRQRYRLREADLGILRELRRADPTCSREVLAARLEERIGVRLDPGTIGRNLKKLGFSLAPVKSVGSITARPQSGRPGGYRHRPLPQVSERRGYPSDLTDAQWALFRQFVPEPKPGGRPVIHDRRDLANAIFYVTRTGCQWRALPHDFPPWSTVYQTFRQWRAAGVWQKANEALRASARRAAGRDESPSAAIIDSQVAKTTEKRGSVDLTGASA